MSSFTKKMQLSSNNKNFHNNNNFGLKSKYCKNEFFLLIINHKSNFILLNYNFKLILIIIYKIKLLK